MLPFEPCGARSRGPAGMPSNIEIVRSPEIRPTAMSTDWIFKKVQDGGEEVNLKKRRIGDAGAKEIARALMDPNTKCKRLDLRGNKIGVEGPRKSQMRWRRIVL